MKLMIALMRSAHSMPMTFASMPECPAFIWAAAMEYIVRIMTGEPMAPAICRTVFVTAEPAETSAGLRQLSDHVVTGIMTKPMPICRMNWHIEMYQIHVPMPIRLIIVVPRHNRIVPAIATGRAPKRSSARPPKNWAIACAIAPGSMTRPLIVAE